VTVVSLDVGGAWSRDRSGGVLVGVGHMGLRGRLRWNRGGLSQMSCNFRVGSRRLVAVKGTRTLVASLGHYNVDLPDF